MKHRRQDVAHRHELDAFLAWLTSAQTQTQAGARSGISARSFRRRTGWCWNITPRIPVTGEIYDQIQLDGIYLGSWCCLIAISPTGVIGYQWCNTEKRAAWEALLGQFPAPAVVINDGAAGLLSARKHLWPETRVQRCLVHIQRNIRRHITTQPRTVPGKELRQLSLTLTRINTTAQAAAWLAALAEFHQRHRGFIFARTRHEEHTGPVPGWVRPGQRSWFTHDRLRKAYVLLERCVKNDELFTYLDGDLDFEVASTTNQIEGGINAQIRLLLRHHRGLPEEHMRRAVEWFLYLRSEDPQPSHHLIRPEHHQPQGRSVAASEEQIGPVLYDSRPTDE
ncbi:IS1249 family transposase [Actinocorallia glomerata]|uniref:IS1249 family transposase n=3 Tax=Actinomycetota TaxID=201174 RepID=A0ABP6M3H7_9MICC